MAKRSIDSIGGADKAKVRVFFAEVEGNNESVQEALKTMLAAMNRPAKVIADQRSNGPSATLLETASVPDDEQAENSDEEVKEASAEPAPSRAPRGSGKKTDRNAGLELVPDLNFRPSQGSSFKDFVADKAPKNDVEAVVVYVYFLHHNMGVSPIGPKQIFTAFKEAGRPVPADLKQTIRNVKSSRMWINFSDLEDIKITTQGENFVEHEIGKNDKR